MSVFTILLVTLVLSACQNDTNKKEELVKLYENALEYSDATTAKLALTQLVLLEPDSTMYKDSLARLYIQQGNYEGGTKLAQELHDIQKADDKLLELLGVAYQQLEDNRSADVIFSHLFNKTNNYRYAYQQVAMAMANTPLFDSLSSQLLKAIEADSSVRQTQIDFPASNNTTQLIPMEPAVYYLIARQAVDVRQDARRAEEYYVKAIEGYDSFELARYHLSELYSLVQGQYRR